MKKSLSLFIFVLALSCAFALGQQSTVGQSTDQNTHDHSINPEQAQSQDANSGKSSSKAMVDDQGLHKQIQEQLSSNPAFSGVQVEVDNGTAKLTGTVASKDDKKKAKEMAKGISGVKKVKDEITVSANSASGSATGNMNQSSMGAAQSDQNTAGSISGNAGSSTTSTPSNSTSTPSSTPNSSSTPNPPQTASASDSTAAAPAAPAATDTMASNQAATATPDASAAAAGSVASQSAQSSTTGAQSSGMQSSTTPASASGSSDQVKSDIQTALRNEPTLTSSSVSVDVSDDSIQLSGSANSAKDRDEAKRIAQSFAGNRRVVDNIKVSGGSDMSTPSSTSPGMSPSTTPNSTSPNSSVTPNSTATPNSTNPEQPSVPKK